MTYDLTNPLHRKQFAARANKMLEKHCTNAVLVDESKRTPNQNSYLHVLIRMMALYTGVKEDYAKDMYFKRLANPRLFVKTTTDPITGNQADYCVSSSSLTVEEMSRAISNFRMWAEENGYYLPEADVNDDDKLVFKSEKDEEAFKKAELETNRASTYID